MTLIKDSQKLIEEGYPLLLSKSEIASRFGYYTTESLRNNIFTDTVLKLIGMDYDEYRRLKNFNRVVHIKVFNFLRNQIGPWQ